MFFIVDLQRSQAENFKLLRVHCNLSLLAKLGEKVCVLNVSWKKTTCFTKFDFFQCQVDGKVRADMFYPAGFMDMVWTPITQLWLWVVLKRNFPQNHLRPLFGCDKGFQGLSLKNMF